MLIVSPLACMAGRLHDCGAGAVCGSVIAAPRRGDGGLRPKRTKGMREQGIVTRIIPPDRVEVAMPTSEACGHCGVCHRDRKGENCIEAWVAVPLKEGDRVEVEIATQGVVAAGMVVYLLPLLFLVAGYFFGTLLADLFPIRVSGEAGGILCAFAFLAASLLVVRWIDRRVNRKGTLRARVARILPAR